MKTIFSNVEEVVVYVRRGIDIFRVMETAEIRQVEQLRVSTIAD